MVHVTRRAGLALRISMVLSVVVTTRTSKVAAQEADVPLSVVLAHAQLNAPVVKLAEQRLGYADAQRSGADVALPSNPTLEIGLGPRFNGSTAQALDFYASLGQSFEVAGERGLRQAAATRFDQRLQADLSAVRWNLRCDVVQGYRAASIARQRAELAAVGIAFMGKSLMLAQRRLAAGEINLIDARLVELEAASARQRYLVADQALRDAQVALADLSGWNVEAAPHVERELPVVSEANEPPSLAAVLALAGTTHPELVAHHAAAQQAVAEAQLADREVWTKPSLGVQVAREGSAGSPANYIVLGVLGVSLPLWERNQAERARHRVDAQVARTQESIAARQLRVRIVAAHGAYVFAAQRLSILTSQVMPLLEELLALVTRGFESGEMSVQQMMVPAERFVRAKGELLDAYEAHFRALIELERATGRELNGATR